MDDDFDGQEVVVGQESKPTTTAGADKKDKKSQKPKKIAPMTKEEAKKAFDAKIAAKKANAKKANPKETNAKEESNSVVRVESKEGDAEVPAEAEKKRKRKRNATVSTEEKDNATVPAEAKEEMKDDAKVPAEAKEEKKDAEVPAEAEKKRKRKRNATVSTEEKDNAKVPAEAKEEMKDDAKVQAEAKEEKKDDVEVPAEAETKRKRKKKNAKASTEVKEEGKDDVKVQAEAKEEKKDDAEVPAEAETKRKRRKKNAKVSTEVKEEEKDDAKVPVKAEEKKKVDAKVVPVKAEEKKKVDAKVVPVKAEEKKKVDVKVPAEAEGKKDETKDTKSVALEAISKRKRKRVADLARKKQKVEDGSGKEVKAADSNKDDKKSGEKSEKKPGPPGKLPTTPEQKMRKDKEEKGPLKEDPVNADIAKMNPTLMSDYVAQQVRKYHPDLSAIELEERYVSSKYIFDCEGLPENRTLKNVPVFLKTLYAETHVPKNNSTPGHPHTMVICASAIRAVEFRRALLPMVPPKQYSSITKLFSRHIRLGESLENLTKYQSNFVVGTPKRIHDCMINDGPLKLDNLRWIVVDMSRLCNKNQNVLEYPDLLKDLVNIMRETAVKKAMERKHQPARVIFY